MSGCFQPKWDGPWSIVKFTGSNNTNCKIVNCKDPRKKLNVHVNQLKLVEIRQETEIAESTPIERGTDDIQQRANSELFLDYLDDFEEDDRAQIVENVEHLIQNEDVEQPAVGQRDIPRIDQRWVRVDESNIIHGARTRGNRPDYRTLAAGDGDV